VDLSHSGAAHVPLAVLESIGEGITMADGSGRIVFSNRAADVILGVPATNGLPETWSAYYGVFLADGQTPFPTQDYPLVRALHGDATDNVEMFIRNANVPAGVLIAATGRPLRDARGAIVGATVVFRDITEMRRQESERRRINEELRLLQQRQAELSALIVHDLKSPLATILTNVEMQIETQPAGDARDSLQRTWEAARRMHGMILDLLDVHLAEDGALVPSFESVDVMGLFREVGAGMASRIARRQQHLEIEPGDGPLLLQADPELLRRLLQNLVDNCVKYGPAGGAIRLGAMASGAGALKLRVRDDGPGVPPAARQTIFEKYAQIERGSGARERDSRGLGLRFCQLAAQVHGGRIWVEDNVPQGACFCVELPIRR
jgi:signal transduction histidine kinase